MSSGSTPPSAAICSNRCFAGRGYRTLLDIGGSTGVVAHAFARRFDLRATVVDPAPLETAEAQALGLETIEGLIERIDLGDRRFDVIMLCQTVDHLLDVTGTLSRVRELLTAAGIAVRRYRRFPSGLSAQLVG